MRTTLTLLLLWITTVAARAALQGEVLVVGSGNSAPATNALRVTGVTNTAVKGNLTAHSGTFTNLTASRPVESDSGQKLVSGTVTGTGAFVKDQAPTIDSLTVTTALTVPDNTIALGTKTTGNYAASSSEAGPATSVADNSVDGTDIAIASQAAGDIMYYNGTDWVRLAKGTAGQVLEMNAGATAPEWDTDDTAAGGETAGTVHNSGTPVQYALPKYADTTGTNLAPSNVTTDASGTNLFTGTLTASNSITIGTTVVTIGSSGSGAATFTAAGGNTEMLGIDLGTNSNTATFYTTSGVTLIDLLSAALALSANSVEVGHATDSTLTRGAAGFLAVEGKRIASPASAVAGDVMYFDGTEWVRLAKGTAGQVLEMNAGATAPEWDTDDNSGSNTTFDAIGDSAANGSVTIGHTNIWDFTLDGSRFLQFLASDADNAADTTLLTLAFNDAADANSIALDVISDADGTPASVFKVSTTAITTTLPISGATVDAANNVVGFTSYQDFVFPSRVDGAGTTIVTNDYTSGLWGLATSNGTADTNGNYAIFRVGTVPYDNDSATEWALKGFSIRVSGTDTDAAQFTIGLWSPASSSAYSPTDFTSLSTFINFDSGTLTSPAANDIFYFSDVTLTGWAAAVTAGRPLIIGIARRNGANDDSVTIVSGTIASKRTQ